MLNVCFVHLPSVVIASLFVCFVSSVVVCSCLSDPLEHLLDNYDQQIILKRELMAGCLHNAPAAR